MRRNVVPLTGKRVTMRVCPDPTCARLESQLLIDRAMLDFDCPKCRKTKLSEFQPIKGYVNGITQ